MSSTILGKSGALNRLLVRDELLVNELNIYDTIEENKKDIVVINDIIKELQNRQSITELFSLKKSFTFSSGNVVFRNALVAGQFVDSYASVKLDLFWHNDKLYGNHYHDGEFGKITYKVPNTDTILTVVDLSSGPGHNNVPIYTETIDFITVNGVNIFPTIPNSINPLEYIEGSNESTLQRHAYTIPGIGGMVIIGYFYIIDFKQYPPIHKAIFKIGTATQEELSNAGISATQNPYTQLKNMWIQGTSDIAIYDDKLSPSGLTVVSNTEASEEHNNHNH